MFSLFRMFFDWKKLKEDIPDHNNLYAAALSRHELASSSLTNLLNDMQQHGPIVEKPVAVIQIPNVEPLFRLPN